MVFHTAKLRVKELAEALDVDAPEIIALCTLLKIPASSPLSTLSVDQCKEVIDYFEGNVPLQHEGFLGQDNRIQNTEITIDMRDSQWQPLVDGLVKGITEYKKDYIHLDSNMSPWSLFPHSQIMRYKPGEVYKYEHCEHGKTNDGNGLSRIIAWQINLNTSGTRAQARCIVV